MAQIDYLATYKRKKLTDDELRALYNGMLKPRLIEEKMLKLLRQGKVSKWFSGIGQEAICVGITLALEHDEFVFPMHRNLGVFTTREIPLYKLFAQWQGKADGFTKGRDRSFHFGTPGYHIVGMISHLGPQLALACGVALAHKLANEPKVVVAFTGEGGTSEGDFHEALNVASVWQLPVLFVIENNGYGLSTPVNEQYNCSSLSKRGIGYGMDSLTIDGNNAIEVYSTAKKLAENMRHRPAPVLLECMTFRRRGHEEASGVKYVPAELISHWARRDPVINLEAFLLERDVISSDDVDDFRNKINTEIDEHLSRTEALEYSEAIVANEMSDIFAPDAPGGHYAVEDGTRELRFVDAVAEGIRTAMSYHDNLVLMGQDIAAYGGVFKVTEGLMDRFGADRVRNTPLCESAIVGVAVGLSIKGFKSMVEMQFADFVTCGFNQIVNNAAKLHYRWGQNVDTVIRMPTGAGVGAGPFHSQSTEAWFFHVPGIKIVYPSNPADAKGLLLAAFEDPNPVMYFEHKALYRNIKGEVPVGYYTVPIGKAALSRTGNAATVVTYGAGVHWALEYADEAGLDIEILDLRTLNPLDWQAVSASAQKTGRVLILHEATLTGGVGAEISAYINEHLFEYLDAPVVRCASLDTPVPFASHLENQFLPRERFKEQLTKLISY